MTQTYPPRRRAVWAQQAKMLREEKRFAAEFHMTHDTTLSRAYANIDIGNVSPKPQRRKLTVKS